MIIRILKQIILRKQKNVKRITWYPLVFNWYESKSRQYFIIIIHKIFTRLHKGNLKKEYFTVHIYNGYQNVRTHRKPTFDIKH